MAFFELFFGKIGARNGSYAQRQHAVILFGVYNSFVGLGLKNFWRQVCTSKVNLTRTVKFFVF